MGLRILDLQQGTGEWLSHRAACLNASDAPAMKGVSKYRTRSDLIREKATGIQPEYDAGTLARFRAGHDAEANIRPHAENIIGEELYPVTGENEINGLRMSASSDGLTMDGEIGFEHKIWNEAIAESVRRGVVPESHIWQIVHQHAVFGLKRTLFMVSDGTSEKCEFCWVEVSQEQIDLLIAGWRQFDDDVKNWRPEDEFIPAATVAATQIGLPSVFIRVEGKIALVDNLSLFGEAFTSFIDRAKEIVGLRDKTDQDYANLDSAAKAMKRAEEELDAAENSALGQTESIDSMRKEVSMYRTMARDNRLMIEKLVKSEKESRKTSLVMNARSEIQAHIQMLNTRLGGNYVPLIDGAKFSDAIKGLKSIDSMKEKVGNALRDAQFEASKLAERAMVNRGSLRTEDGQDLVFLFPDFAAVCTKQIDDFAGLLSMRITSHREVEAKRLEVEREKIRAEEQAKTEREAQAKARAEQAERDAESAIARAAERAAQAPSKRAVVIEHQDEIAAFINSRDFKDQNYVRGILVEFVKFQAAHAVNNKE
jgi:predicted phage-related endonuclease